MEAYESSTVGPTSVADTVRVPSKVLSKVHVYTKINHTVGPTVQYLYVVQLYTYTNYTYSTYLWTEIGYSIIRSYQIFEGTLYFRKYFRRYESTKVRKYLRTKYFRTFVLSKVLSYERKVRRYESKLLRK